MAVCCDNAYTKQLLEEVEHDIMNNHKHYNFLACD